jgi:putative copper resistance protein D
MKSPDPQTSTLVFHLQVGGTAVVALVMAIALGAWYVLAVRRLRGRQRAWSPFRPVAFFIGLLAAAYSLAGGVAYYDVSNFSDSVIQHLLLFGVAPPLLAMGAPLTLALQASSPRVTARALSVLNSRAARFLAHPVVSFAVLMATLYVFYLTPVYSYAAQYAVLRGYADLQFLAAGCVFWWPMVGRDALPRRVSFGARFVAVFVSVPFYAALGLSISGFTHPLYPAANTVADTKAGGNILWALAEIFLVVVLALLFVQWAREEELKAVRADRQLDAALAAARSSVAPAPPPARS